jgi:hypothetical protein
MGAVTEVERAVGDAFRAEWGRVVAHLIRVTGDWDLAEECAQDAFARALERWPRDGVPANRAGWLKTTARNRAMDRLRRASVGEAKLRELAMTRRADVSGYGYHQTIAYQPPSRYWPFQWAETALFAGVAVILIGFCFWWINGHRLPGAHRRTAAPTRPDAASHTQKTPVPTR